MSILINTSDKSNKWSDYEKSNQYLLAPKAQALIAALTLLRYSLTQRLSYRNIQTLWKIWLPVHDWSRAWPQILLVRQFSWTQAPDDLYSQVAERQGSNVFKKSHQFKKDLGEHHRNQSRIDFTTRTVLNVFSRSAVHHFRCQRVCNPRCQYGFGIYLHSTNRGALL